MECKKLISNNPKETFLEVTFTYLFFNGGVPKAVETSLEILELDPNDFDSINNINNCNVKLEILMRLKDILKRLNN